MKKQKLNQLQRVLWLKHKTEKPNSNSDAQNISTLLKLMMKRKQKKLEIQFHQVILFISLIRLLCIGITKKEIKDHKTKEEKKQKAKK